MHVILNTAKDKTIAQLREEVKVLKEEKEEHVLLIHDQHEAIVYTMERAKELATAVVVQRDKKIARLQEEVRGQDEELKKKNHEVSQLEEEIKQKNMDIHFKDSLLQFANDDHKNIYTDGYKLRNKNRLLKSSLRESQKVKAEDEARLLQSNREKDALREENDTLREENDTLWEKIKSLEASIGQLRRGSKKRAKSHASSILEGLGK